MGYHSLIKRHKLMISVEPRDNKHKTSHVRSHFYALSRIGKIKTGSKLIIVQDWGQNLTFTWTVTACEYRVSLEGNKNGLTLILMMIVQLCGYKKQCLQKC